MPGYKVLSLDGKEQFFTVEDIPRKLFGEPEWQKMKEGHYLPWVEVVELRPLEDEALLAIEAVDKEVEFPWTDEDDARR